MKRILVPTNFSSQAAWAVEVAADLVRRSNAILVLLHVVEYPTEKTFDSDWEANDVDGWEQDVLIRNQIVHNKKCLDELAGHLSALEIPVIQLLSVGNLFQGISAAAIDYSADLIVMGTTRRSKIEEVLDKSKTEQVIKFSTCPVLTIHHKPSNLNLRNIVYATSASKNETGWPRILTDAQKLYGAKLHIVTINTSLKSRPEKELRYEMENLAQMNELTNYSKNVVSDSSEEVGIVRFAESIDADLIVIATHGRESLAHEVNGNVAQDVVNHSSIPVLTYAIPN